MPDKIDVVITWVDGSDVNWLIEKNKYLSNKYQFSATSEARFRDWNSLKYIFRGIDRYMPWVNRVFFVTWGHIPDWLNTNNNRITIINHTDYIPDVYLPTFNSNCIELNFHRIPGLSENFIYFNDDTFVINEVSPEDFFSNGVPLETAALTPFVINPGGIACIEMNNLEIINKHFSRKDIMEHKFKWFHYKYGFYNLRTLMFSQWNSINGIYEPHIPMNLKKSSLQYLWKIENEAFERTCSNRFRTKEDINIWLIRQWHILKGNFHVRSINFGKYYCLPNDFDKIIDVLGNSTKVKMICINDSNMVEDFEKIEKDLNSILESKFPEKSSFER